MLVDAEQRGGSVSDTFVLLCVQTLRLWARQARGGRHASTDAGRGTRGRRPPHRGGWRGGRGGRGRFGPPRPPQEGPHED